MQYPSNRFEDRSKPPAPKAPEKIESVVKGSVTSKEPSRSFAREFFSKDLGEIKDYVIFEVLLPKSKDMLFDLISNGASMLIFGNGSKGSRKPSNNGTYISYNSIASSSAPRKPSESYSKRSDEIVNEIIFDRIDDAESVLDALIGILDQYDIVTVGAYYDLCGVETTSRDFNYGWKNLSSARTRRLRDGYILDLPKAIAID